MKGPRSGRGVAVACDCLRILAAGDAGTEAVRTRAEKRAALRQPFELKQVWRPQGDSNPCYCRERAVSWASRRWGRIEKPGGARRDRTADLYNAIVALSQLSYGPGRRERIRSVGASVNTYSAAGDISSRRSDPDSCPLRPRRLVRPSLFRVGRRVRTSAL